MKKIAKIVMSMLMVCMVLFSLAAPVSAATVKTVSYSTTNKGGNKATVFYVNAKNTKTTKIKYTCTTGHFITKQGTLRDHEGYFEVKIWGRNKTTESWNYISKTNIKDVTSKTLSMKGYTQYKVQVYAWKASTIGSYMGGICNSVNAGWCDWAGKSLPKCTFKAYSNVSSLAK